LLNKTTKKALKYLNEMQDVDNRVKVIIADWLENFFNSEPLNATLYKIYLKEEHHLGKVWAAAFLLGTNVDLKEKKEKEEKNIQRLILEGAELYKKEGNQEYSEELKIIAENIYVLININKKIREEKEC